MLQLLGAMGDLTDDRLPLNSPLYLFPTKDAHVPLKGWAEEHGLSSRACDLQQLGRRVLASAVSVAVVTDCVLAWLAFPLLQKSSTSAVRKDSARPTLARSMALARIMQSMA